MANKDERLFRKEEYSIPEKKAFVEGRRQAEKEFADWLKRQLDNTNFYITEKRKAVIEAKIKVLRKYD